MRICTAVRSNAHKDSDNNFLISKLIVVPMAIIIEAEMDRNNDFIDGKVQKILNLCYFR